MAVTEERRLQLREATRAWRARNPEKSILMQREWRKNHKDVVHARNKKYRSQQLPKSCMAVIKYRAKKAGLEFDLTPEWYESHYKMGSALSGIPFQNGCRRGHNHYAASVDRIDNEGGYTKDNCRLILQAENAFKGTISDDEILEIAARMLEYHIAK